MKRTRLSIPFSLLFAVTLLGAESPERYNRGVSSAPREFVSGGALTLFSAYTPDVGRELWRTDGTEAGTALVADFTPGSASTEIEGLVSAGTSAFFMAVTDSATELWVTDGTAGGTTRLAAMPLSYARRIGLIGDVAVVALAFSSGQVELWRSDGTVGGTFAYTSFASTYAPGVLHPVNGLLMFTTGYELRATDGTHAGTTLLSSTAYNPAAMSHKLVFQTFEGLSVSDGTVAKTAPLVSGITWRNFHATGNRIYFSVNDTQLWMTDGSTAETALVTDFGQPISWIASGEGFTLCWTYGIATNSTNLHSVSWSDHTPTLVMPYPYVTRPTDSLYPGAAGSARLGAAVLFAARDNQGTELWRTDGTPGGTILLKDVNPSSSSFPIFLATMGGAVLFQANNGIQGAEPWISDGTTAGTEILANLAQEGSLSGSVLDAAGGAPIAGVQVTAQTSSGSFSVLTGADGAYAISGLRPASYQLWTVNSDGWINQWSDGTECSICRPPGPSSIEVTAGVDTRADFHLRSGGRIAGRVTDGLTGDGLADVTIQTYDAAGLLVATGTSNSNGDFITRQGLMAGSYRLLTSNTTGLSNQLFAAIGCHAGCALESGTLVPISASETATGIDFQLLPRGSVSGVVTDAVTGEPVPLVIRALRTDGLQYASDTPDATGGFEITLQDGGSYLETADPYSLGYVRQRWPNVACPASSCSGGTVVAAEPGTTTAGYDFALQPVGGRIGGVVRDSVSGEPVTGAQVRVVYGSWQTYAQTDEAGLWRTRPNLPAGDYTIEVAPGDGYVPLRYGAGSCESSCAFCLIRCPGPAAQIAISGTDVVSGLDLQVDRAIRIRGEVRDRATAALIASGSARLIRSDGSEAVTVSLTEGAYEIPERFPPGTWYLLFAAAGYQPIVYDGKPCLAPPCDPLVVGDPILLGPGEEKIANALMLPSGRITGRVIDAVTGDPVSGFFISSAPFAYGSLETAPDGTYTWTSPIDEDYVLSVSAPGHVTQYYSGIECGDLVDRPQCDSTGALPVELRAGTTVASVDFTLRRPSSFAGRVTDEASGDPIAEAGVFIFDANGGVVSGAYFPSIVTDADGRYSTPAEFLKGDYYLCAIASGWEAQVWERRGTGMYCFDAPRLGTPVALSNGEVRAADFALRRPGSISGILRNAQGYPVVGAVVEVFDDAGKKISTNGGGSAHDGKYALPGLSPGAYFLKVVSFEYGDHLYGGRLCGPGCDVTKGVPVVVQAGLETSGIEFSLVEGVKDGSDFDGDGRADLLWRQPSTGKNIWWSMNGASRLSYGYLLDVPGSSWSLGGTADFNADGKPDLLWRNAATGQNVVWLMNGTSRISYTSLLSVPAPYEIGGVGDFDRDGDADIVWRNPVTGQNVLWTMNGTTRSSYATFMTVPGAEWRIAGTGDFDQDGDADIVWRNGSTGQNVIWFMDGATRSSYASALTVIGSQWRIQAVADYDGDGDADLFWRNVSTGQNVIWFMNGAVRTSYATTLAVTDLSFEAQSPR